MQIRRASILVTQSNVHKLTRSKKCSIFCFLNLSSYDKFIIYKSINLIYKKNKFINNNKKRSAKYEVYFIDKQLIHNINKFIVQTFVCMHMLRI